MKIAQSTAPHRRAIYVPSPYYPESYRRQRMPMPAAWPPHRLRVTRWWDLRGEHLLMLEREGIHPHFLGKAYALGSSGRFAGTIRERGRVGLVIVDVNDNDNLVVDAFPELDLGREEALAFAAAFLNK
ncbi:MAG: hypothetical protein KDB61_05595 [Planctomycetes bacterium]|nr:hypothetical protein [Planctomycetota bacterium]